MTGHEPGCRCIACTEAQRTVEIRAAIRRLRLDRGWSE